MGAYLRDRILTPEQAAELLGMTVGWIYSASRRNRIPKTRVGGKLRFFEQDLLEYARIRRNWPRHLGADPRTIGGEQ